MLKKNVRKHLKNKATFNLFIRHYIKNYIIFVFLIDLLFRWLKNEELT